MTNDPVEEFLDLQIVGDDDLDQDKIDKLLALVRVYREGNKFMLRHVGANSFLGIETVAVEEKAVTIINGKD